MVTGARAAFKSGRTKSISFRRQQLESLLRLYEENTEELLRALEKDLRKPRFEAYLYEIVLLIRDVKSVLKNLNRWTKPTKVSKNLLSLSDSISYAAEPYGVVR